MIKSRVTFATCLLFLLVYILEVIQGGNILGIPAETLVQLGASTGPLTIGQAQYARLLSCILVHANLLHLGLNIYVLIDFGPIAEASLGRKTYVFVFWFSGIIGALVSILYNPTQTSVGASAAILGILGAVIYKNWFDKEGAKFTRPQLVMLCVFLLYSLLLGFTVDWIDNAAHLGGFFAGMLASAAFYGNKGHDRPGPKRAIVSSFGLLLLIPFLISGDGSRVKGNSEVEAFVLRQEAAALVKKKDFAKALELLNSAQAISPTKNSAVIFDRAAVEDELKQLDPALADISVWLGEHPKDVKAHMLKAAILHKLNRDEEAITSVSAALDVKPSSWMDNFSGTAPTRAGQAMLYNNRAWFELSAGKAKEGLEDVNQSLEIDKNLYTAFDTRGVAFLMLKNFDAAQKDFNRAIELNSAEIKNKKGATEDGAAYYHRACARVALGDKTGAQADMDRFKSLDYKPEPWEPKP